MSLEAFNIKKSASDTAQKFGLKTSNGESSSLVLTEGETWPTEISFLPL